MEKNNNSLTILVDFDGTCVTHDFPRVGKDIGAVPVLKKLVQHGHRLILFTMRCDHDFVPTGIDAESQYPPSTYLTDAVNWFKENDIPLYGINTNPTQKNWTSSPKAFGHIMIDDTAIGCPLKLSPISDKLFIDWPRIEKMLEKLGFFNSITCHDNS